MSIDGARRVMQTTSSDVANQYLRFGWKLINQHALPATEDQPPQIEYVLASIRTLEDTRAVITHSEPDVVNEYLRLGWKLIDKYVTSAPAAARSETMHFVLAWQTDFGPTHPGDAARAKETHAADDGGEIEVDDTPLAENPAGDKK